jgi:hypothetical protein
MAAWGRRYISKVGEDVGCDEYIVVDRETRQIPGNKSGAGSGVGAWQD